MRAPRAIEQGAAGATVAEACRQDAACNAEQGAIHMPLSFMDVKLSPCAADAVAVPQNS
jgi:hypothetical protein